MNSTAESWHGHLRWRTATVMHLVSTIADVAMIWVYLQLPVHCSAVSECMAGSEELVASTSAAARQLRTLRMCSDDREESVTHLVVGAEQRTLKVPGNPSCCSMWACTCFAVGLMARPQIAGACAYAADWHAE